MQSFRPRHVLSLVLVSTLISLGVVATAQASTLYELTATQQEPPDPDIEPGFNRYWGGGDFSLRYLDLDDDGLFSKNELNWFSGATTSTSTTYDKIFLVPNNSPESPFTDNPENGSSFNPWGFHTSEPVPVDVVDIFPAAQNWTYSRSVVPWPPSAILLGSGLLGLAAWARRKKRWR